MKRVPQDPNLNAEDHSYPAFESDAAAVLISSENNQRPDRPESGPRKKYRVWRCNGVPVGVRIHKDNKDG